MTDVADPSEGLCLRCSEIPPRAIRFPENLFEKESIVTKTIHYFDATFTDGCKLCSVLSRNREQYGLTSQRLDLKWTTRWGDGGIWNVMALEYPDEHPGNARAFTSGWLSFEDPEEYREELDPDLTWVRRLHANKIDWKILKGWIQDCEMGHNLRFYELSCNPPALELPGFLVIDCITRKIVSAPPGCRYCVLSYVWGPNFEAVSKFQWNLPARAPLVIEDAILCTLTLEMRYLWVDRYCIDQEDSDTKHQQIQNMDFVYGCATVAIIDAAGSDSSGGLPGVSITPRQPQEFITIGGKRVTMVPNAGAEIRGSKWWTRGWTYQEGVLAPRRIVFTRSQTYFQCLNMYCCESLVCTFRPRHHPRVYTYAEYMQCMAYMGLQVFPLAIHARDDTIENSPDHIFNIKHFRSYLEKYLERELSYEADALNAFNGILTLFSELISPVYHVWGMPFQAFTEAGKPKSYNLLHALGWIPKGGSFHTVTRRDGFPSWTWAAWRGITGINTSGPFSPSSDNDFDVSIEMEHTCGNRLSVDEYIHQITSTGVSHFKPWLYLTGWTTSVYLFISEQHQDRFYNKSKANLAVFADPQLRRQIDVGSCTWFDFTTDGVSNFKDSSKTCWPVFLYIRRQKKSASGNQRSVWVGLILRPTGDGSYERVGVLNPLWFKPLVTKDDKTGYLRAKDWNIWHRLKCEKRTIKLV